VLGREGATRVLAVQHKAVDTVSQMLIFTTADGRSASMTPAHGVWVDGKLVAASEATVGATLTNAKGEPKVITRITKGEATIINAVTASGTIVADGILAASNPFWIADRTVDAPLARAVLNCFCFAAGDVDSVGAGVGSVIAKFLLAFATIKLIAAHFKGSK